MLVQNAFSGKQGTELTKGKALAYDQEEAGAGKNLSERNPLKVWIRKSSCDSMDWWCLVWDIERNQLPVVHVFSSVAHSRPLVNRGRPLMRTRLSSTCHANAITTQRSKKEGAPWPIGLLCPNLQSYKRWDSRYGKKVVPLVSLPLPL